MAVWPPQPSPSSFPGQQPRDGYDREMVKGSRAEIKIENQQRGGERRRGSGRQGEREREERARVRREKKARSLRLTRIGQRRVDAATDLEAEAYTSLQLQLDSLHGYGHGCRSLGSQWCASQTREDKKRRKPNTGNVEERKKREESTSYSGLLSMRTGCPYASPTAGRHHADASHSDRDRPTDENGTRKRK